MHAAAHDRAWCSSRPWLRALLAAPDGAVRAGQANVGPGKCARLPRPQGREGVVAEARRRRQGQAAPQRAEQLSRSQGRTLAKAIGLADPYDVKGTCVKCHATVVRGSADSASGARAATVPGSTTWRRTRRRAPTRRPSALGMRDVRKKPDTWVKDCLVCHVLGDNPTDTEARGGRSSDGRRLRDRHEVQAGRRALAVEVHGKRDRGQRQAASATLLARSWPALAEPPRRPTPAPAPAGYASGTRGTGRRAAPAAPAAAARRRRHRGRRRRRSGPGRSGAATTRGPRRRASLVQPAPAGAHDTARRAATAPPAMTEAPADSAPAGSAAAADAGGHRGVDPGTARRRCSTTLLTRGVTTPSRSHRRRRRRCIAARTRNCCVCRKKSSRSRSRRLSTGHRRRRARTETVSVVAPSTPERLRQIPLLQDLSRRVLETLQPNLFECSSTRRDDSARGGVLRRCVLPDRRARRSPLQRRRRGDRCPTADRSRAGRRSWRTASGGKRDPRRRLNPTAPWSCRKFLSISSPGERTVLERGEIFGEGSALSRYPIATDIIAASDGEVPADSHAGAAVDARSAGARVVQGAVRPALQAAGAALALAPRRPVQGSRRRGHRAADRGGRSRDLQAGTLIVGAGQAGRRVLPRARRLREGRREGGQRRAWRRPTCARATGRAKRRCSSTSHGRSR